MKRPGLTRADHIAYCLCHVSQFWSPYIANSSVFSFLVYGRPYFSLEHSHRYAKGLFMAVAETVVFVFSVPLCLQLYNRNCTLSYLRDCQYRKKTAKRKREYEFICYDVDWNYHSFWSFYLHVLHSLIGWNDVVGPEWTDGEFCYCLYYEGSARARRMISFKNYQNIFTFNDNMLILVKTLDSWRITSTLWYRYRTLLFEPVRNNT